MGSARPGFFSHGARGSPLLLLPSRRMVHPRTRRPTDEPPGRSQPPLLQLRDPLHLWSGRLHLSGTPGGFSGADAGLYRIPVCPGAAGGGFLGGSDGRADVLAGPPVVRPASGLGSGSVISPLAPPCGPFSLRGGRCARYLLDHPQLAGSSASAPPRNRGQGPFPAVQVVMAAGSQRSRGPGGFDQIQRRGRFLAGARGCLVGMAEGLPLSPLRRMGPPGRGPRRSSGRSCVALGHTLHAPRLSSLLDAGSGRTQARP